MFSNPFNSLVISLYEAYPYEILIIQDSYGKLLTLKVEKNEFRK
jgi:hypothetical protein